jgi:hypothetical protein
MMRTYERLQSESQHDHVFRCVTVTERNFIDHTLNHSSGFRFYFPKFGRFGVR